MLAVIETHPIQYHAPVYRALTARWGVPVTAIYGSDFSVRGYRDAAFGAAVTWDTDLLSGYQHRFLSNAASAEEPDLARLSAAGVSAALNALRPAATLIVGYSPAFHRQAWRAARRHGCPVLFRGETVDDGGAPSMTHLLRRTALTLAYRSCARLLYIGERSRKHYRACGVSDDRLVFSPYCVDPTPFRADEASREALRTSTRHELGIQPDRFVVLFSGKLSERKGVDLLPGAMRRLPATLRDRAVLLCLGDGTLRSEVEHRSNSHPAVRTVFVGVRRQTEMSRFYHASDALVLPSRRGETWGLVVNEALLHGVPCVVSDRVGCAPDLVGPQTGATCQADSIDALALAIGRVSELSGRLDIRRHCRERVAAYSVDAAAAGIADAYRAVVAPGRAA